MHGATRSCCRRGSSIFCQNQEMKTAAGFASCATGASCNGCTSWQQLAAAKTRHAIHQPRKVSYFVHQHHSPAIRPSFSPSTAQTLQPHLQIALNSSRHAKARAIKSLAHTLSSAVIALQNPPSKCRLPVSSLRSWPCPRLLHYYLPHLERYARLVVLASAEQEHH